MSDQQNEGRGALEQQPPRVPWAAIARAVPWTVWGVVALVIVLRLDTVTPKKLEAVGAAATSVMHAPHHAGRASSRAGVR